MRGFTDKEGFEKKLRSVVTGSFERAGFSLNEEKEEPWIDQISDWIQSQPKNSLVLLIDEFDAPQVATLDNRALFDEISLLLSSFYIHVKSSDAAFRFVFITGITNFNQSTIFSGFNTLRDITFNPAFGALLGYTKDLNFPQKLDSAHIPVF